MCLDAVKCRAQATKWGGSVDADVANAWKETTSAVTGSGAAGSADLFASKYPQGCKSTSDAEKASELKFAALPKQRRVVAQLFDATLTYATGEVVAAAGAEGYAWACNATTCPASAAPALPTWRLLRAKAAGSCHPKAATSVQADKDLCAAKTDL